MNIRPYLFTSGLALLATTLPLSQAHAASFDFGSSTQFTDNFRTTFLSSGTLGVVGGRLEHNIPSGSGTAAWVYDTTPNDTTAGTATKYGNVTVEFDFTTTVSNISVGIYFGGLSRTNSALALFNMNTEGTPNERIRIFRSGAEMGNGNAGTSAFDTTLTNGGFTTGATYHVSLNVAYQTSSSALVTFTISDPSNTVAAFSVSEVITGLTASTGEIAFRSGFLGGTGTTSFDNISITASVIPEPSTYALLGGLGALGLVATRRRRR